MTTAVLVPPSVGSPPAKPKTLAASAPATAKNADEMEPSDDAKVAMTSHADAPDAPNENNDVSNTSTSNGDAPPPPPAANRLKRAKSTPAKSDAAASKKAVKRRRVSFESAEIVEFEPTVFTTTVTSGGIPVGMSLTERSRSRRRLDSWEMEREDLRVGRQNYMEEGYLDPAERELILNNAGCAEHSMLTVEAEVNQIIAHRRESNEVDFDFLYGLVSIGEEEEEDEEEEEEDEEEEEIEEVQLLSDLGSESATVNGDELER